MRKPLPNRVEMDFEGGLNEVMTAHAGVTLLVELGRISQVMATAERCLRGKKSPKGLGQGQFVESFVLLSPSAEIVSTTLIRCDRIRGWRQFSAASCPRRRRHDNGSTCSTRTSCLKDARCRAALSRKNRLVWPLYGSRAQNSWGA